MKIKQGVRMYVSTGCSCVACFTVNMYRGMERSLLQSLRLSRSPDQCLRGAGILSWGQGPDSVWAPMFSIIGVGVEGDH